MSPAADPPSNLDQVLKRVGRASTPPVPTTPFGITRGALLKIDQTHAKCEVIIVGPPALVACLGQAARVAPGVPGALTEQVSMPNVTTLVIDWRAFSAGPWLAANTHAAKSLANEIFEAGRIMRASGRPVLGIPHRPFLHSADAYLFSTCTVDCTAVPLDDLEEGAPHTRLWEALQANLSENPLEAH